MQQAKQELQRFTVESWLGNDDNDDNTGEDDLSWWSRYQFAYLALVKLVKNLATPAYSVSSESVEMNKRNRLGACLNDSQWFAWSSLILQESHDKDSFFLWLLST